MSATVFCNFDQQDIADLAMGELRASIKGIKSIHYVNSHKQSSASGAVNAVNGINTFDPVLPSYPVTVKIVCVDNTVDTLVSRLINLRAYQIITTR